MPTLSDSEILANHQLGRFQEPLDDCEARYPVLVRKGYLESQKAQSALASWREYRLTEEGRQLLFDISGMG